VRAAVLGSPVAHSLSPVLHGAAYRALGLDGWSYDRHECDEAALPAFVAGLGPEWAGLSLTMPLKRVTLDVAAEVDPLAAAVGAANTLVLPARRAHNTDVAGIAEALGPVAGRAVVLGAGGTAQATLAALAGLGVTDVTVAVRDTARAAALLAGAERLGAATPRVEGALVDPARAADLLGAADVVVSTLPAGAADALGAVRAGATVLDVVYAGWPTPFAAAAARAGARVVSGLEVLLHQAVAQVELMTGMPGPTEAMREALDAAVGARAGR
jgi:shikimate-5-dehydrogenase